MSMINVNVPLLVDKLDRISPVWYKALLDALPANYLKPKIWTSGADLLLGIGQSAKITASAATSIPLHVACGDGQIYEMEMAGTYTLAAAGAYAILQPNNTTYTNVFEYATVYSTVTSTGGAALASTGTGFMLDPSGASVYSLTAKIFTSTATKRVNTQSFSSTSTVTYSASTGALMQDTTTLWSSLGTVILPNAWSGEINLKRIA